MKNVLFINGGKRRFADSFHKACKKFSIECTDIRTRHIIIVATKEGTSLYYRGIPINLKNFEYAFFRVKGRGAHISSIISHLLLAYKVPFNDETNTEHVLGDEKVTQAVLFSLAGVSIPKTIVCSLESYKLNKDIIYREIAFPCVLKTSGSRGQKVWKVLDENELETRLKDVTNELSVIQEYIPNTFDIRALFFYDEYLGAIKRSSSDGFYNNVAKGGTTEVIDITSEEKEISQKACSVMKIDFGGVDIVRTENGPLIFEVNKGPQVYGFEDTTGKNVPEIMLKKITALF